MITKEDQGKEAKFTRREIIIRRYYVDNKQIKLIKAER